MKTRLPKALLALISIAAVGTAQADIVTPTHIWSDGGEMILRESPKDKGYTLNLKDGQNDATITKNTDTTSALYVREGTLVIGGQEGANNHVKVSINPVGGGQLDHDDYPTILNVAGNNAKLVIDNATVTSNTETSMSVGGPDGSGTLIIQNGGQYLGNQQNFFFIGYQSYRTENSTAIDKVELAHATTKQIGQEPSAENRYDLGSYSYNSDKTREYGRAIVTVTGEGSRMETGLYGMHMGDGELNILDGAVFNSNNYALGDKDSNGNARNGGATSLGEIADGTSVVNVKNGGVWNIHGQLHTGNTANSSTIINVENATVNLLNLRGAFLGLGYDRVEDKYFTNGSTTAINLMEGAKLNVSEELYIGVNNDAVIKVAKTAVIKDFGNIHGANDPGYNASYEGTPFDRLIVSSKGILENAGTIDMLTVVDGGIFTMVDGAVAEAVTATTGTINLSGNVTFTGDVMLGSLAKATDTLTINIEQGSTIYFYDDVNLSNAIINVLLSDETFEGEQLFTIASVEGSAYEALQKATLNLQYDGSTVSTQTGLAGVKNVSLVPEPTTATLSLLALMGLAARRRRK